MTKKKNTITEEKSNYYLAIFLGCGLAIGAGLGAAIFGNSGLGSGIGIAVGVGLWAAYTETSKPSK